MMYAMLGERELHSFDFYCPCLVTHAFRLGDDEMTADHNLGAQRSAPSLPANPSAYLVFNENPIHIPVNCSRSIARFFDGQVVSWYDNEMGYSTRVVDLIAHMAKEST